MTIKTKLKQQIPKIEIDLTGDKGNIFYLLNLADSLSKQLGLTKADVKGRMMRCSYEDAVKIFDAYFGDYVTLYATDELREALTA